MPAFLRQSPRARGSSEPSPLRPVAERRLAAGSIPGNMRSTFRRQDVTFTADGVACGAWLYLPEVPTPPPVIVMAHGLGGVRELRLDAFAERFSGAGYACLVFDYRHFGSSAGEPRQLLSIRRQREDWAAAVRWVRERPEVDGDRVVLWGTSFSGGHVLATAADDPAITAVIAQCPFTDGVASARATSVASSLRILPRALADLVCSALGLRRVMLPLAGPPRSAALMTALDSVAGTVALRPQGVDFRDEVTARIALDLVFSAPGRRARDIACPVLFCVCEHDTVAPAKATLRAARRAPRHEIEGYPCGHFDIYLGDAFERVVAAQIAFLGRQLGTRDTPREKAGVSKQHGERHEH